MKWEEVAATKLEKHCDHFAMQEAFAKLFDCLTPQDLVTRYDGNHRKLP